MKNSIIKRIVAILFVALVLICCVKNQPRTRIRHLLAYLKNGQVLLTEDNAVGMDGIDADYDDHLWKKQELIDLNGTMAKELNIRGAYSDMGMYILDGDYIVSATENQTSGDYEFKQMKMLKEFADEQGIHLLYVNEPTKYVDDSIFSSEFGIESYSNRNMDVFLERIRQIGVPTIDLRKNIEEENLNIKDLFYRTDHHWTTKAALWGAKIVMSGMNQYCGYHIDTSLYDLEQFDQTEWKECWLGEQGRKVSEAYVGLDDFTKITPKYETNYLFKTADGLQETTFAGFINEDVYNTETSVYDNMSWHYSYMPHDCINQNIEEGKVLLLGDSYEQVTEPLLSLGVHEMDFLILRDQTEEFHLADYILDNGYDTVLLCYAQFMLGAHDDPTSANYNMYTFFK